MIQRPLIAAALIAALPMLTAGAAAQTGTPATPRAAVSIQKLGVALDESLSAAFNAHDLARLMALFADDIEFYHDTNGLQHRAEVQAGFGGLFAQGNGITREILPGTLKVYELKDYGLLTVGAHRFCHDEESKPVCGTFEFAQVWRKQGDGWKISRVLSYGH